MTPDVFDALANPIRRALLAQLRGGPQPAGALAARFTDRSRAAVSEHLAVLRRAGLVVEEPRGRERVYHLDAAPLRAVQDWLADYAAFWDDHLDQLAQVLQEESP